MRAPDLLRRTVEPHGQARYGWHLIGPGSARWGWAAYYPSGAGRWLGRTARVALASARVSGWIGGGQ